MPGIPLRNLAFLVMATTVVSACAPGATAINESLRLLRYGPPTKDVPLKPGIAYLRVESGGGITYMALGYVEAGAAGETEIWYSATGEVLKISNGRIVGSSGLATDWREVRLPPLPHWNMVGSAPIEYERERDEMPGYRVNLRDTVFLRAIAPPTKTALIGFNAKDLAWYEESTAPPRSGEISIPASRFAVVNQSGRAAVTYAEQCLAANFCLSWQRWPAPAGSSE